MILDEIHLLGADRGPILEVYFPFPELHYGVGVILLKVAIVIPFGYLVEPGC